MANFHATLQGQRVFGARLGAKDERRIIHIRGSGTMLNEMMLNESCVAQAAVATKSYRRSLQLAFSACTPEWE